MIDLQPGDVLLYKPSSVFGWFIRVKTWHAVSHVEVYMGNGCSTASRDGKGVNIYPLRTEGLIHILRPSVPFDAVMAMAYINSMIGTPYGWLDLVNFSGWAVDTKGIVCSPFATLVLRAAGIPIFNDEPPNLIAPFQFLDSELLKRVGP